MLSLCSYFILKYNYAAVFEFWSSCGLYELQTGLFRGLNALIQQYISVLNASRFWSLLTQRARLQPIKTKLSSISQNVVWTLRFNNVNLTNFRKIYHVFFYILHLMSSYLNSIFPMRTPSSHSSVLSVCQIFIISLMKRNHFYIFTLFHLQDCNPFNFI